MQRAGLVESISKDRNTDDSEVHGWFSVLFPPKPRFKIVPNPESSAAAEGRVRVVLPLPILIEAA